MKLPNTATLRALEEFLGPDAVLTVWYDTTWYARIERKTDTFADTAETLAGAILKVFTALVEARKYEATHKIFNG